MQSKTGTVLPKDGQTLPEPIANAINDFFEDSTIEEEKRGDLKAIENLIDNITQDALHNIDQLATEDGAETFRFMRQVKKLLVALRPYAKNI